MKKYAFILMAALLSINPGVNAQRGTIVQADPIAFLTPVEIMQNLHLALGDQNFALIDHFTYKNYPVQVVKILYQTIDGKGNPTVAAGVVFLPVPVAQTTMPVFSYLHGTLTRFADLPSNLLGIESVTGWIMAMDGYISVLPDYIGMGVVPGIHPYCHAASEASAAIDLLVAMNSLCANPAVLAKPNGNLYLSGYSQGAHAALATQRELERNPLPFLTLRKTVAGSGAYSLSVVQKKYMFDHPDYPNPSFIPYLLMGLQSVYGNLYSSLNQVFIPPYNSSMPGYFNGLYDVDEIDLQLPPNWKSMFVPSYLWSFQNRYFDPVNVALRDNDLINWKPATDLHLYYCTADEQVDNGNSLLAYLSFVMMGSKKVTCLPVGPFAHAEGGPIVLLLAKIQFDCASGINPCGLKASADPVLAKAMTPEALSMFKTALDPDATIDINEVYANQAISDYLDGESDMIRKLDIYPNPVSDLAVIDIPVDLAAGSRIMVYDMQGKLILNENVTGNRMYIDVKPLDQGLYKVVIPGNHNLTGKVVVTR
jgi:hypothetical protein